MSVKSIAKKAFKSKAITEEEYKQLLCVINYYYKSLRRPHGEWIFEDEGKEKSPLLILENSGFGMIEIWALSVEKLNNKVIINSARLCFLLIISLFNNNLFIKKW